MSKPPGSPSAAVRGVLLFSATLTIMAGATIAPSLPQMSRVFAEVPGSDVLVRLVLTITALAIALSAPLAGFLVDRVGRKPVLVGSLVLYAVAGVSGYLASTLPLILVGRVLLGVAVAGVMTAGSALAADLFAGPRRAAFLGLQSAFTGFGGVLFLPLGGLLASLGWREPFLVYLASLLILPFAVRVLREPERQPLSDSSDRQVELPAPVGLRQVLPIYLLALFGMVVFYMYPTQIPFYLQGFKLSPTSVGIYLALTTLMGALASLGYSRLRAKVSFQAISALSLGLMGLSWLLIGTAQSLPLVALGLLLLGVGNGWAMPNLAVWITSVAPPASRGRLLGGLTTAIFLGQFCSPLITQPLTAGLGLGAVFAWVGGASLLIGLAMTLGGWQHVRGAKET